MQVVGVPFLQNLDPQLGPDADERPPEVAGDDDRLIRACSQVDGDLCAGQERQVLDGRRLPQPKPLASFVLE